EAAPRARRAAPRRAARAPAPWRSAGTRTGAPRHRRRARRPGRAWRGSRRTRSLPCHLAEACHRVVEAALHGAARAAENLRHLLLAEVVVVAQDDDAPLRLGQRGEEAARIERRIGRCGRTLAGSLDARRPGKRTSGLPRRPDSLPGLEARLARRAAQPGHKAARLSTSQPRTPRRGSNAPPLDATPWALCAPRRGGGGSVACMSTQG